MPTRTETSSASDLIDLASKNLREWVASVLAGVHISSMPPGELTLGELQGGRAISLYLLDLIPAPPGGNSRRAPLQLCLRYLVTAWAEEPDEANRMLNELAFAAMESSLFDVELEPLPITAWTAFGVKPRPSFAIRVPLRLERPELADKFVRKPIVVQSSPLIALSGVVLTTSDIPIAGARIEVPGLAISQLTDSHGHFHLSPVPATPRPKQLKIRSKRREIVVDIPDDQPASEREPLVIRFDPI
jgi:hypothetical protein